MTTEKLDIIKTIKDGVQYGLKNFFPLLLMVILYFVTFWIPYLNVGTTIGLYKAIIGIGRGETIDPVSIFSKENFRNIGNFFLLEGLSLSVRLQQLHSCSSLHWSSQSLGVLPYISSSTSMCLR